MVDFVPAAYAAITVCSFAVVLLYGRAAWSAALRYSSASQADQLILGIVLGFAAGSVYFPYWIVWRVGPDGWRDILESHWVIGIFAAFYVLAALSHVRAASLGRCGERGWQMVAIAAFAAAAFILAL